MPGRKPRIHAGKLKASLSKVEKMPQESTNALKSRNKALEASLAQQKSQLAEAKKELGALSRQTKALVDENKKLADEVKDLKEEHKALVLAANRQHTAANRAIERAEKAEAELKELQTEAARSAEDVDDLKKKIGASAEAPDIVSADKLGTLIDQLVNRVEKGATGLSLNGGKMTLQLGVTDSKEGAAFVLPSATTPPEKRGPLHTMEIDFQRLHETES